MSTVPTYPAGTGEDRSASLLASSIAFGIALTLIVILRIGYRTSKRLLAMTDLFITLAMVSLLKPRYARWRLG